MSGFRARARARAPAAAPALVLGFIAAGYILFARPWQLRWGVSVDESDESLEGDELIADASLVATRGITVHAAPGRVWPWIAQLGQGRGGFQSYDFLENLVGCDIHSADRIVAAWQTVRVGDAVRLAPTVGLEVARLETGRSLVLRGGIPMGRSSPPCDFTWAFIIKGGLPGTTRLVVRERYGYARWWAPFLVEPLEIVSFLMHQKMLRGIRSRAERCAPTQATTGP